ncbi:MAG: nucleoside deaminase [Erysipelotrichaceae bacterium]|nr:nucleoside deaminase [Erysipelotrichaceae bacterium]
MDDFFMQLAMEEARLAALEDEIPVGAVIVYRGEVIAKTHNRKEHLENATKHAEIEAIDMATKAKGNWYLDECTLYVTMEPCMMCTGAIVLSRIDRVVIGALEKRWPAMTTLLEQHQFNHHPDVDLSRYSKECSRMLSEYFRKKRQERLLKDN